MSNITPKKATPKKEGEMSEDMAEFIKRKRAAESGGQVDTNANQSQSELEKQRRREEIMRRVEERKKKKLEEQGADEPKLEQVISEEVKIKSVTVSNNNNNNNNNNNQDNSAQVEEVKQRLTVEFNEEKNRLSSEISTLRTLVDSQKEEIKRIRDELGNKQDLLSKESAKHSSTIQQQQQQIETLTTELNSTKTKLSQTNSEKESLRQEKEELSHQLQDKDIKISFLTQENAALSSNQSAAVQNDVELLRLKEELAHSQSEVSKLQSSLAHSKEEHKKESALLTQTTDALSTARDEIAKLKNLLAQRDSTISSLREVESELRQLDSKNQKIIQENEEIIVELQREQEELKAGFNDSLTQLKAQNKALESQLVQQAKEASKAVSAPAPSPSPSSDPSPSDLERLKSVKDSVKDLSHPNPLISQLLLEINDLRSSPSAYSEKLKRRLSSFDGLSFRSDNREGSSIHTKEGEKALLEAIDNLSSRTPVPLLRYTSGLSSSCLDLVDSNGPAGVVSDKCVDGTTSEVRLKKYGKWKGKVIELTSYGPLSNNAEDILFQWIVDDGNPSRRQREMLLDGNFSVIGIAAGGHKQFEFMVVIALSVDYIEGNSDLPQSQNNNNNAKPNDSAKSELKETDDGKGFIIVSDPFRVPKENLQLQMKSRSLILTVQQIVPDPVTITKQWSLPFAVSPNNISASYNERTEVVIVIKKAVNVDNNEVITTYNLEADTSSPDERVKIQLEQQSNAIVFTTKPCTCHVAITLKIVEGATFCFESVYTQISEENGSTITKTITRKESVKMPFNVTSDRVSIAKNGSSYSVTVLKPSGSDVEINIPIA